MLVFEVADPDVARLAALTQFLIGRVQDTASQKPFSVAAYIGLANNLGIALTPEKFQEMSQTPPLNAMIANIEGDKIIWRNQDTETDAGMPVDRARDIVAGMAKNQARKSFQE